jgi:hypothetical protein
MLLHRIVAGDHRGQHGHQQQEEHHRRAYGGQAIPPQFPGSICEDVPGMSMRLRQARLGDIVKLPCLGYSRLRHAGSPYAALRQTNAWIQETVREVNQEVHQHKGRRQD